MTQASGIEAKPYDSILLHRKIYFLCDKRILAQSTDSPAHAADQENWRAAEPPIGVGQGDAVYTIGSAYGA